MAHASPPPGVTFLDHTADVGIRVRAPTVEELFRRAALGALALVEGREEGHAGGGAPGTDGPPGTGPGPAGVTGAADGPAVRGGAERRVTVEADGPAALLRAWLREVLWWHEVEGAVLRQVRFERLDPDRLEAEVVLDRVSGTAIREIKGVTLHGLRVVEGAGEWRAQVIFDV